MGKTVGRGRTGQRDSHRGQAAERSGTGSATDRKDRHAGPASSKGRKASRTITQDWQAIQTDSKDRQAGPASGKASRTDMQTGRQEIHAAVYSEADTSVWPR